MNGVIGKVEDIYPEGGGLVRDREWVVNWLEGVREREEEMCRFREVFDLEGHGRRVGGPGRGELGREAVRKNIMHKGDSFWARETYEEGGADFYAAT
jgi:hypothetical protein